MFFHSLRSLSRSALFTTIAVATLAFGMGACLSVFSVISGVLLRPLPYGQPESLVLLWERNVEKGPDQFPASPANFRDWRSQSRLLRAIAAFDVGTAGLSGRGEPRRVNVAYVSGDFFSVLGVPPLLGRSLAPADDLPQSRPVAVLSHRLWKEGYGGDRGILGRVLNLEGQPYEVVGVMPEDFRFPDETELWTTMNLTPEMAGMRDNHYLRVIAALRPGGGLERARSELDVIARRLEGQYPETNAGWSVDLVPLRDQLVGDVRPALIAVFGAVGLVFLLACVNVASLVLARALRRRRECAIRMAMGASRWKLVRQFFTEGMIVALLGGALGLVLAHWGTELLTTFGPAEIPRLEEIGVDARVAGLAVVLSILAGLFLGVVPVFLLKDADWHEGLRDRSGVDVPGFWGRRGREALLAGEILLTLVLIIGAGLLIQSFRNLRATDLGFRPQGVFAGQLALPTSKYPTPESQGTTYRQLLDALSAMPGVRSVAIGSGLPFTGEDMALRFTVQGRPLPSGGTRPGAKFEAVSPGYFRTLGIPLLSGRDFSPRDSGTAPRVLIIDETMARQFWPGEDPLGQRVLVGRDTEPREIVGVVRSVRHGSLEAPAEARMYVPLDQHPWPYLSLIARADSDTQGMAGALRNAVWSVDKEQAISEVVTLDQLLSQELARPRFSMQTLTVFAALALFLAAVGVYGLCSYMVEQKAAEMGIRMALGARAADILRLVLRQGLRPVVLGGVAGLVIALMATRVLTSLLYSVEAFDLATYLASVFLLGAVALLASAIPARRAAQGDPVVALKRGEA